MNYLVVEHLSGSKAKQIEEFPLSLYPEILVGRDLAANVRFTDAETLVGRQHLKITQLGLDSLEFRLTDLNSRNGTFLNGNRITGSVSLKSGDVVQCGPNGPSFRFEMRPSTEALPPEPVPTASAFPGPAPDEGRLAGNFPLAHLENATPHPARPEAAHRMPAAVATPAAAPPVVRTRKPLLVGGILVGLVAIAAGVYGYRSLTATGSESGRAASASPTVGSSASSGAAASASPEAAAGDAEKDAERLAWRIEVAPYRTLGGGRPGKGAVDIDKPDGVAFSPKGVLYATDAGNHRVQVWDVKTGTRLGEFGHGIFGGEIVDIAVAPNETVYITDQTLNLAYTFVPPKPGELDEKGRPLGPYDYQFKGTRFGEQKFEKLGGIAIDSRGRIYVVDAHRNDVHRFNPDNTVDKSFKFEKQRADGTTYLHGCEGVAIDEAGGNLFIASEKDATVVVFDWETGAYKHQLLGATLDGTDKPGGKHVFFGSVEGLTIARGHLLAVDESAGHIQLFDLQRPDAFNRDLSGYVPAVNRPTAYRGFFGHGPMVNFEDKTNIELQKQVKAGSVLPGQSNPPGYFCSPDSISSYNDAASNESYIAIADQCNYRLVVYRWSDISKALGQPITIAEVKTTPTAEPSVAPVASKATATPEPLPRPKAVVVRRAPRPVVVKHRPAPVVGPAAADRKNADKASDQSGKKKKKKKSAA